MPLTNVTPSTTASAVRRRRTLRASTPLIVALHILPILTDGTVAAVRAPTRGRRGESTRPLTVS